MQVHHLELVQEGICSRLFLIKSLRCKSASSSCRTALAQQPCLWCCHQAAGNLAPGQRQVTEATARTTQV